MDYIYILQASEQQYQKLMNLLDTTIKREGLESLQDVVDIYNLLVSGKKLTLPEETQLPKLETTETTAQEELDKKEE